MLFNEFGSRENPPILLLHGIMQDWRSEYELLKPLEEHYRLILLLPTRPNRSKNTSASITAAAFMVHTAHRRVG